MNIRKSVLAGMLIGLGALSNLMVNGGWLGALLFSCGLLTICINGLQLVTGKFGPLYSGELSITDIFIILLSNICGVFLIILFVSLFCNIELLIQNSQIIVAKRLALNWYNIICSGAICGMCIQIAVSNYLNSKNPIGVILPVMVFIMVGSAHCIADTFYLAFHLSTIGFWTYIVKIFEVFIGNFIGATLVVICNSGNLCHYHLL